MKYGRKRSYTEEQNHMKKCQWGSAAKAKEHKTSKDDMAEPDRDTWTPGRHHITCHVSKWHVASHVSRKGYPYICSPQRDSEDKVLTPRRSGRTSEGGVPYPLVGKEVLPVEGVPVEVDLSKAKGSVSFSPLIPSLIQVEWVCRGEPAGDSQGSLGSWR